MFSRNIDEINAYANGDDTFAVEIHTHNDHGEMITITIPRATFDAMVTGKFRDTSLEIVLRGVVS